MDMDTTVKGLPMDEQSIRKAIIEILDQSVDDGIEFQLLDLTPIREDDEYENFRASIQATYGKMKIPMKIDITTGDEITPKEVKFFYPFLFDDRRVMVKAYTQETILAEKYETIIRRNVGNTRARDFYDLHLLYRLYRENADWNLLKQAVFATAKKRDSLSVLQDTGIGRISCSAGFMEKVSGTKFICKRDYISCNHGNRKRVYRENEFLARKVNEVSYHGTY